MDIQAVDKFALVKKIGSGAFGTIYLGTDTTTGEEVAVKLESLDSDPPQLWHEADVYKLALKNGTGIPKTLWSGIEEDCNVLVMELLGPSLEDLFDHCGRCFSLKTVLMIADQLLDRIEYVHSKGFLHMDVKPDNFLIGLGEERHTIYVIDFGLAKRYVDETTKRHIGFRTDQKLTGTARYASINTHKGIEQSRRDDLEALGYVLIYFLRGSLPWQGLKANTKKQKCRIIEVLKKTTSLQDLCGDLPVEFQAFLEYTRDLGFGSTPDYAALKESFKDLFDRKGLTHDNVYDWSVLTGSTKSTANDNSGAAASAVAAVAGTPGSRSSQSTPRPPTQQPQQPASTTTSTIAEALLRGGAGSLPAVTRPSQTPLPFLTTRVAHSNPQADRVNKDGGVGRPEQRDDARDEPASKRARLNGPSSLSEALPGTAAGSGLDHERAANQDMTNSSPYNGDAARGDANVTPKRTRRALVTEIQEALSGNAPDDAPSGFDGLTAAVDDGPLSSEEEIKAAIEAFQAPAGQRRLPVPRPRKGRSLLYLYGVVAEDDVENPDPRRMHYYCMANAECRFANQAGASASITVQKTATGNGTRHLKRVHGVESVKTRKERDVRVARGGLLTSEDKDQPQLQVLQCQTSELGHQRQQQQPLPCQNNVAAPVSTPSRSQAQPQRFAAAAAASTSKWAGLGAWVGLGERATTSQTPSKRALPVPRNRDSPAQASDKLHQLVFLSRDPPSRQNSAYHGDSRGVVNNVDAGGGREHQQEGHEAAVGNGDGNQQHGLDGQLSVLEQQQQQQQRDMAIMFVKLFVVSKLMGFDVGLDEEMRAFLRCCVVPGFPEKEALTPEGILVRVEELYSATKATFLPDLLKATSATFSVTSNIQAPTQVNVALEIWTDADSEGRQRSRFARPAAAAAAAAAAFSESAQGERYVGLRVFWLTERFESKNALLAVKRLDSFALSKSSSTRLSTSSAAAAAAAAAGRSGGSGSGSGGDNTLERRADAERSAPAVEDSEEWKTEVLDEYGIPNDKVFATVTDEERCTYGGDLKAAGSAEVTGKMPEDRKWEWSIAHMLSRVLSEAFEPRDLTANSGDAGIASSGNDDSGAYEIVDSVMRTVARLRLSSSCKMPLPDLPSRPRDTCHENCYWNFTSNNPNSWLAVCKTFEVVLTAWDDLENHYRRHEANDGIFPLTSHKTAVEEVYSVVKPVAALIERTGRLASTVPAGVSSLVELATLRLTVAEPTKPLLVQSPSRDNKGKGVGVSQSAQSNGTVSSLREQDVAVNNGSGTGWDNAVVIRKTSRAVDELQAVTASLRAKLRAGLDKHFFNDRYNEDEVGTEGEERAGNHAGNDSNARVTDYLLEMTACMDPFLSQLTIIDSLASSPRYATKIKSLVWDKVVTVAASLAETADAHADQRGKNTHHNERNRGLDADKGTALEDTQTSGDDIADSGSWDGKATTKRGDHDAAENSRNSSRTLTTAGLEDNENNEGHGRGDESETLDTEKCQNTAQDTSDQGRHRGRVDSDAHTPQQHHQGEQHDSEDVKFILASGLFGQVTSASQSRPVEETHRERAEAELESFKALGAKRSFGSPPLDGLQSFWASERGHIRFPYIARVARVLLSLPASCRVSKMSNELRGAEARLVSDYSSNGGRNGASASARGPRRHAEMVLFLHLNRGLIPNKIPALSTVGS